VLLLVVLLAGAALAAALLSTGTAGRPPRAARGPADGSTGPVAPAAAEDSAALPIAEDLATESVDARRAGPLVLPRRRSIQRSSDPLAALRPERFAGRGEIRVRCTTPPGVPFPERWVLELGPARALIGSELAETRRIELDGSVRETVVSDLPLAGYEVRASAPLFSAEPVLLLLSQPNHTSLAAQLRLEAAGFVTGRVVDPDGAPVEGFELWLEETNEVRAENGEVIAQLQGERRSAVTDVLGVYRFDGVLNGEYLLHVGPLDVPLREPFDIAFRAPTLTMPPIEVPALCELEVEVYDAAGLLVGDALVQGWSTSGGRVAGRTDVRGRLAVRLLPPGEYTLLATHERLGRGRGRAALAPGTPAREEISLRP
jgi:hypothetical protein